MKTLFYLVAGFFFGIIMYKSEAASWFRIYEMFEFASFHMYGIFVSALAVGITGIQLIKKYNIKAWTGNTMQIQEKPFRLFPNLVGGIIFGLGWALVGACPGPMYVLAGAGYISILVVITGALGGTLVYGLLEDKLPR